MPTGDPREWYQRLAENYGFSAEAALYHTAFLQQQHVEVYELARVAAHFGRLALQDEQASVPVHVEKQARNDQAARIAALEAALREAIEEYEYAITYKGEYLTKKHDDMTVLARLRAVLEDRP